LGISLVNEKFAHRFRYLLCNFFFSCPSVLIDLMFAY
jgi:hypothetical protein